jgi:hypothetical protein
MGILADAPTLSPTPEPTWTMSPLTIRALGDNPSNAQTVTSAPVDPESDAGMGILAAIAMGATMTAGVATQMMQSAQKRRDELAEQQAMQYAQEIHQLQSAQAGQKAKASANMAMNMAQVKAGKQQVVMARQAI